MGKEAPEHGWQRAEQEWVDGRGKHKKPYKQSFPSRNMIRTNDFGNTSKKSGNLEYTITAELKKTERKEKEMNTSKIYKTPSLHAKH